MIILKKLKLKNFLSHGDTEIDLPLGVTAIIGPNGAGKTAIMDAIIHAFLGFEKDVKTRGENVDDLIRRGANEAEINLVFEANNREYTVQWIRTRGGRVEAYLRRNDLGYIARSAKQVKQEILKILELDSRTLLNSIFIRQGEVTSLVEAMPADRKKLISRIIGLDAFERAWENMREIINHLEKLKSNVEIEIRGKNGQLMEKKNNYDSSIKTIMELKKEKDSLKEEFDKLENQYKLIIKEKESLDEKEYKYNNLKKDYDIICRDLNNIENILKNIKMELEECIKAREEIKKLEYDIKKIDLLESYVKTILNLQIYEREEHDLRDKLILLDEIENHIKEYLSKIIEFGYKFEDEVDLTKINIPDDPITLNAIVVKLISNIESLIEQLREKDKELHNLLRKIEGFLPKPNRQILNEKMEELTGEYKKIENSIKEVDSEIGWIKSRIEKLTQDFNTLDKFDTCPVCRTKLTPQHRERAKAEIFEELDSLRKKLTYVEDTRKKLEILREDARNRREMFLRISVDVENIEKLYKDLEDYQRNLAGKIRELNAASRKVRILREEVGMKLSKVEEALTQIQEELNELIKMLGYKPSDPENELKMLRIKKEKYDRLKSIADRYDDRSRSFEENMNKKLKLEEEIKRIEESINNLGYDPKKHEEIKKLSEYLRDNLIKNKSKLENLENIINNEEKKLILLKNEIKQLEDEIVKLKAKSDMIGDFEFKLEKIRGAFSRDGVQKLLRQRLTPYISELATKYVERFNLDVTSIIVDEDLEVTVMRGGETTPLSLLSGGEKVAIAIALRLAIAKALAGTFSTIIMDEPTIHLDEERRKELVEVVKSFFREGAIVPQMVIITHDRELEEVADTIYQVEKINGISKIVG